jgi:hypothetical protein
MDDEEQTGTLTFPVQWEVPEKVTSRYATHFVVQQAEHEVYLSFFEIPPPFLFGPPTEGDPSLTLRAQCFARVIVSFDKVPDLIRLLQEVQQQPQIVKPHLQAEGSRSAQGREAQQEPELVSPQVDQGLPDISGWLDK